MYTTQQILSLSTSISKIAQPHKDLINFSNPEIMKEFEIWSDRLLNSCTKETLSDSVDEIVFILNRLPNFEYMLLSTQIDETHPGVSFYFIMEGIQHYESDPYKFFVDRLCKFKDNSLLTNIYSPTRARLIVELLKNIKPSTPAEIFKVNDEEIIFVLKDMLDDWEEDEPAVFIIKDEMKPIVNGNKKIYLRQALK
jgi:hypothetical protein